MSLIAAGLVYVNVTTLRVIRDFKPIFVRVDDVGRAEVVKYDDLTYRPEAHTIRYFLSDFVRSYYGRNRFSSRRPSGSRSSSWMRSLRARSETLGRRTTSSASSSQESDHADIEIEVKQVAIEQLREPPFKASVELRPGLL